MLKQQSGLFRWITVAADLLMVFAAFGIAFLLLNAAEVENDLKDHLWLLLVILPVWYFSLAHFKLYASLRILSLFETIVSLAKAHMLGGIVTTSFVILTEPQLFPRLLILNFLLLSFVLLSVEKTMIKLTLGYIRKKGFNFRNILIVGRNESSRDFLKVVKQHIEWGVRVVGVLRDDSESNEHVFEGVNVLGRYEDLAAVCRFYAVDEVAICINRPEDMKLFSYIGIMAEMGITARVVLNMHDAPNSIREIGMFNEEMPMLTFHPKSHEAGELLMKRCLDIAGAVVGLLFLVVTFPFIAIAIKLDSKGPVFFSQKRSGLNGRIFNCWKYRSMHLDAEKRKDELMHLNEMSGALFKIKDDPRITRVGKFIRKTSLDEIPQFWNVLKGEMSLVGTRPPTPGEVVKYKNWQRKRICIKPGITGLWQVSGRNAIKDFDEVVKLDLEYIEQWSLKLDVRILFRTIRVVFARNGSY